MASGLFAPRVEGKTGGAVFGSESSTDTRFHGLTSRNMDLARPEASSRILRE